MQLVWWGYLAETYLLTLNNLEVRYRASTPKLLAKSDPHAAVFFRNDQVDDRHAHLISFTADHVV